MCKYTFLDTMALCFAVGIGALLTWYPMDPDPRAKAEGELAYYFMGVVGLGLFVWLPAALTVSTIAAIVSGWRKK